MSWGTCYNGSNNIHTNFPAIMDDTRSLVSVLNSNNLDNTIKKDNNITSNSSYRKFLQTNSDNIIKNNQELNCKECIMCNYKTLVTLLLLIAYLKGMISQKNQHIYN